MHEGALVQMCTMCGGTVGAMELHLLRHGMLGTAAAGFRRGIVRTARWQGGITATRACIRGGSCISACCSLLAHTPASHGSLWRQLPTLPT
jgi:hypothetical protein